MVHEMLPDGNVLPTSTTEVKKFLKVFGFGYDVIHACKNVVLHDGKLISILVRQRMEFHQRYLGISPLKKDLRGCLDRREWLRIYNGISAMLLKMEQ